MILNYTFSIRFHPITIHLSIPVVFFLRCFMAFFAAGVVNTRAVAYISDKNISDTRLKDETLICIFSRWL